MSQIGGFGIPFARRLAGSEPNVFHVKRHESLHRILRFTGRTIDDVVNNPTAKNEVLGYYKLHKFINRRGEIRELERQWNPIS
jgi:hypothetical protein